MELVAVCDTNETALQALPEHHHAKRFPDLKHMLRDTEMDVLSICTPSGLHSSHGILAAEAGCHVVVEKPMATSWQDGVRLNDTCCAKGVKLFVVLQNRYNPTIMALKKAIDQGRFGQIYMITSNVFWTRPQSYYDQAAWRGTWSLDGGAFMNQASHYVDMLCWLGGSVDTVQAFTATLARNIEVEDTGVMNLRYSSGALASLNVTMLAYPHNREGSITVLGEKGFVRIGGTAMNTIETWEFADTHPEDAEITAASYNANSVYGNGHKDFYADIIKSIRNDSALEIDGIEGLKSLELLAAIYDSVDRKNAVQLPLRRYV